MSLRKGKYFCFTLNNYTVEEEIILKNLECGYIIFGHEVAPSTGTPHLQGYVQFDTQKSPTFVKNIIKNRISWRNARGSQAQNKAYCEKEGKDIYESGDPVPAVRGARTDLKKLKSMLLEEKMPINKIVLEHCENYQQIRYIEKLQEYMPCDLTYKKKDVRWYYGGAGAGKTRMATEYAEANKIDLWRSNVNRKEPWFNGYYGQKMALIDDLRAGEWKYALMLQILDGWEVKLESKGGFIIWKPEIVFITTPLSPTDTYAGQLQYRDGIEQLTRRITEIRHFEDVEVDQPNVIENIINIDD